MKKITVNASKPYDIFLGRDILKDIGSSLGGLFSKCKVAVITDDIVSPIYYDTLEKSLFGSGYDARRFIIKSGEASKNIETYYKILSFLASSGFIRSDIILALGGGVVGDIAGFAAATYMRGIAYVQVPTTFLAQIDSSIGGKTAIDLPEGKNLVGAFCQPGIVFIDINTLDTLNDIDRLNGLGEGLKYVVLEGGRLYEIATLGIQKNLEEFIELCIDSKRRIVERDEKESGDRKLLNLGHTLGHALEKLSGYSVPHGICVAKGLEKIAEISFHKGMLNEVDYHKMTALLAKYGFCGETVFDMEKTIEAVKIDKKASGKGVTFVIPYGIGDCRLVEVETKDLENFLFG